jgi:hypothetical protein
MPTIPPDFGTSSLYFSQNFDNIGELLQRLIDNNNNLILAKDVRDPIWTLWNKILDVESIISTQSMYYTLATPSTIDVGGILKGSTFSDADLGELFDKLLLPYQPPIVDSLSFTQNEIEFGSVVPVGISYSISLGSVGLDGSYGIQFISPNPLSGPIPNLVTGNNPESGTSGAFTLTYSTLPNTIQNLVATMSFRTLDNLVFTQSTTIVAKHRRYYGPVSIPGGFNSNSVTSINSVSNFLTDSLIRGLSFSELSTNVNFSQAMSFNNQYFVFASPTSFGFNFPEGFFIDNSFSNNFTKIKSGHNFQNNFGYITPYDIWISNNPLFDSVLVSSIPLNIGSTSSIYTVIVGPKGDSFDDIEPLQLVGTDINFSTRGVWNTWINPGTGSFTWTPDPNDKRGIVQKIYHDDSTPPLFPTDWVSLGSFGYVPNSLNIIYCEYVDFNRVEYWIVQ